MIKVTRVRIEEGKLAGYQWDDYGNGTYTVATPAGETYRQKQVSDRSVVCDCRGYQYRGTCKHADYVQSHVKFTRVPRDWAEPYVKIVEQSLNPEVTVTVAGSYRRGKATVKDLDFVVCSFVEKYALINAAMRVVQHLPDSFVASNGTQTGRIVRGTIDKMVIDLYLCTPEEYGAMLMFLTGPKEFNVYARMLAKSKGMKLSQYGLYVGDTEELVCACTAEAPIFKALGLPYSTPEQREEFVKHV